MKKNLTILVDMDDCIESLTEPWIKWLNEKYDTSVQPSDIVQWEIGLFFPKLTKEQIFEPLHCDDFWKTVKPKPYAIECLKQLIDDGHEIYIVTASSYQSIKYKIENVLLVYFPFIDWKHVIITHNKQMIKGDILIDDGPHNLIGGDFKKILMSRPHNMNFPNVEFGLVRVESWLEIYKLISQLAK